MVAISLFIAVQWGQSAIFWKSYCDGVPDYSSVNGLLATPASVHDCSARLYDVLADSFGTWGGYGTSGTLAALAPDEPGSEQAAFWISNGAQLIYSTLYMLLIYNLTLISMEHDWGKLETQRRKLRCTIVKGKVFEQSYLLQLPKRIIIPAMVFSSLMHWLLAQAIGTREYIWSDLEGNVMHSQYEVCSLPFLMTG